MSYWDKVAWFKSHIFEAHPVYHRQLEWDARRQEGSEMRITTACGMVTHHWDRETGEEIARPGWLMRRDFADRFARPCRKCWP